MVVSQHTHWGVTIHPKPCVEWLGERCVVRVQVCVCVRGDAVERQGTLCPVQVHSYPVGAGRRCRDVRPLLVVPSCVTVTGAVQFPGLVGGAEHAVAFASFPADSFITHWNHGFPAGPLCLPVRAFTQTWCTHHLLPVIEPLRMVGVWLLVYHVRHLSVALSKGETCVCCVWVQRQLAGICTMRREKRQEIIYNTKCVCVYW